MGTGQGTRTDVAVRWKVHRFGRLVDRHTGSLGDRFGTSETAVMRREMVEEYRALIPQVPDIGGRRHPWNSNLAGSAMALAVYRVVRRHGGSAQDAGAVMVAYAHGMVGQIPRRLRPRLLGPRRSSMEKVARWTQRRRYPEDWVCQVVEGAGQPFDLGMDVTECAIVKFMHAQGADEFTPYLCHLDYVVAEAAGFGMNRTGTLAWGCDRCDFRWTVPGQTTAEWPPDFHERTCGRPDPLGHTPSE